MTDGTPLPIAVDAMGGDRAPAEIIAGAVAAAREHQIPIVLVGQASIITPLLAQHDAGGTIPVVHAEEAIAMHEGALTGWRRPRSSVAVACHLVRSGKASALVSAGSTGGTVSTARFRLRTQQDVLRPALAVILPARPRPVVLLDAGATADAKPEMLAQYAQLGAAYAELALGIQRPRTGLLTIGSEASKGNKMALRTHELLSTSPDFIGNIEGHKLLTSDADVIVTDGFTGNVALKTLEGAVRLAIEEVHAVATSSTIAKLGSLLQRRRFRQLRERFDSETYGGGVLLGLNGTVVVAHGSSSARGLTAACVLAHDLANGQIVDRIAAHVTNPRHPRFGHAP